MPEPTHCGNTITAGLCETKDCKAIHVNVTNGNGERILSLILPLEVAETLIDQLRTAINDRLK